MQLNCLMHCVERVVQELYGFAFARKPQPIRLLPQIISSTPSIPTLAAV